MTTISMGKLNELSKESFVETLKDIFEHSPWVAERIADQRTFWSVRGIHSAMVSAVANASDREQLALIRAHPDLAGKAALAGDLTASSTAEQAGAGLDSLNEEELEKFHSLNNSYNSKFGFPFILAVKGHDKHSILRAFETRLENSRDEEQNEALKQIAEIARIRLESLLTHEQE